MKNIFAKEIFTEKQFEFFEKLENFREIFWEFEFKMFWWTWLALQIWHRKSEDFDFITQKNFDSQKLAEKIFEKIWKIEILQLEKNTLTFSWNWVLVSFFWWFLHKKIWEDFEINFLKIYSIDDILAMKISAILNRSTTKDFFDLAYSLEFENKNLEKIIQNFYEKYWEMWKNFPLNLILKSISYIEDAELKEIFILKQKKFFWKKILEKSNEIILKNIKKYLE